MQENNFGPDPTLNPAPAPAPEPASAPEPNPYQPNPAAAPIDPMSNTPAPKKSHAGLIIVIILVVLLAIGGTVAAILIANNSSAGGKVDDKKTSGSSEDKKTTGGSDDKKTSGGDDGGTGTGTGSDDKKTTTSGAPKVEFDGISFTVADKFGDNVRALSSQGNVYISNSNFELEKVTNIDSYLSKTYTHSTSFDDEDEDSELPFVYVSKKEGKYVHSFVGVSGWYFSTSTDGSDKTKKYADLESYVTLNCDEKEKISLNGQALQCGVTKIDDVKTAFPGGEANEEGDMYELESGRYSYRFDFYENVLEEIMIDHYDTL